jgi:hypothetical protein
VKVPPELEAKILRMAGGVPRKRRPTAPRKLAAGWAVELTLPCVVRSEPNARDHWAVRRGRFRAQAAAFRGAVVEAGMMLPPHPVPGVETRLHYRPPVPCVVTLTHVGPRMDDDNLAGAFKGLRDAVAGWLRVDDGDGRVAWRYDQRPGRPPGVLVRFAPADAGGNGG